DAIYAPVCSCDGVTYGNECEAAAAGVSIFTPGECGSDPPNDECGGLQGLACDDGEYCNFPPDAQCGAADQTGTCAPRPEVCNDVYDPVCGCDDRTYGNACEAAAAGVSVASEGPCEPTAEGACGGLQGLACVDARGEPHITDFGIAANVRTDRRLTHEGAMMGTPAYMSPEQINGELMHIGPATDVYSLGATLFHVLTGREVFPESSVLAILSATLRDEPAAPHTVAAKHSKRRIPPDLDTICLKALEKQSSRRYSSARALAEDLEAFADDRPVAARPISMLERLQKSIRRNRAFFALTTVVVSTLLVIGLAFGAVTVFNIQ